MVLQVEHERLYLPGGSRIAMAALAEIQFGGQAAPSCLPVPAWKVCGGGCALMMLQLDLGWVPGSRSRVALWHGR